ncbi:hypothetical protein ANCCEY_08978 [Ancylostoma ceylanicum]|uniref:UDP-glucuronosyltransferase n=1 Tax=Ancylostoma ceylanicum TaxID=53326 RepID=A0A0D6LWD0_9BILA|nr:hypothetical protein ANCCEY_08978 [Ancylostoma ceylanicum]
MEGRCISMDDMNVFMTINKKMFKGILEDTPFLNSLREQRFDVALHEVYEIAAVAIFEMIGIKNTVVLSALGVTPYVQQIAGFPANPSFVPDIIEAFASFPDTTFIWKYEEENDHILFEKYPNIHPLKWVPQVDLLADKRISLFITHAGMNSVLEAVFYGKPMVAIPLFVDQIVNAKNMNNRGLAVVIDKHDLSKDALVAAIRETLPANGYVTFNQQVCESKEEHFENIRG